MLGLTSGNGAQSDLGPVNASARLGEITLLYPSLRNQLLRERGLVVRLSHQSKDSENTQASAGPGARHVEEAWSPVKMVTWPGCGIHAVIPKGSRLRAHLISAREVDGPSNPPPRNVQSLSAMGEEAADFRTDDGSKNAPKVRVRLTVSRRQDDSLTASRSSTLTLRVTASALSSDTADEPETATVLLAEVVIKCDSGESSRKRNNECVLMKSQGTKKAELRSRAVTVSAEQQDTEHLINAPKAPLVSGANAKRDKAQIRSRHVTLSEEDNEFAEPRDDGSDASDFSDNEDYELPRKSEKSPDVLGRDVLLPPSKRPCFARNWSSFDGLSGHEVGCSSGSFDGFLLSSFIRDVGYLDDAIEFDDHERSILRDFNFDESVEGGNSSPARAATNSLPSLSGGGSITDRRGLLPTKHV